MLAPEAWDLFPCIYHPSLVDVETIAWEGIVPKVGGAKCPFGPCGNPAVEHGEKWRCSFWPPVLPWNTDARKMALAYREVPHRRVFLKASMMKEQGPCSPA